jgi:hypothetical protein
VAAWRAAGLSREQYEKEVLASQRGGPWPGFGQIPVTCYISFCSKCTPHAQELRRRLQAEGRPATVAIQRGYHLEAIQKLMAPKSRLFGLPDYLVEAGNWRCLRCTKSVNTGATRNSEQPALTWVVPAVIDQLGRQTAGPVTASLCARCAPIVDSEAREAFVTKSKQEVTT